MSITIKRAYEPAVSADGYRVLVDRVWPRGLTKHDLHVHAWYKNVAPSSELRKWFGHQPARWAEFRRRYTRELNAPEVQQDLRQLAALARHQNLTLVYGARDTEHNQAVVLQECLNNFHSSKRAS